MIQTFKSIFEIVLCFVAFFFVDEENNQFILKQYRIKISEFFFIAKLKLGIVFHEIQRV